MQPNQNPDNTPRVAVIVATYNERSNIEQLIPALMTSDVTPNVLIVDDRSPDGTGEAVRKCMARFPGRVALVEREGKLGYGSAIIAGFKKVLSDDFDVIVTMDADFSHDPRAVASLVESLADADLCIGSRYVNGIRILNWSMSRLLLSAGANLYVNTILRYGITDCTSGFRAYRSDVLRGVDLDRASARGYAFLVELLELVIARGGRVAEAPIVYTERRVGKSKMSRKVIVESVVRPWILLLRRLLGR
ncbi:MAG: polyprenol monophosphomannose synthase [Myxococcota bacterium]